MTRSSASTTRSGKYRHAEEPPASRRNHIVLKAKPDAHIGRPVEAGAARLPCGTPTGDIKDLAGGEAAGRGGDERRHIGNLLWRAQPAHWNSALLVGNVFRAHPVKQVSHRHRRCDTVHGNLRGQQFTGQPLGKTDHAGFRRAIGHGAGVSLFSGDRGDDDDPAPLARPQMVKRRLHGQEHTGQIDRHHRLPFCQRIVPQWLRRPVHPGIRDNAINIAKRCEAGGEARLRLRRVGDIDNLTVSEDRVVLHAAVIEIPARHPGPKTVKQRTDGKADALGGAGDNEALTSNVHASVHLDIPFCSPPTISCSAPIEECGWRRRQAHHPGW